MSIANVNIVDQQLVQLSQAGDLKAFGLLVEKYQNRLYRMILRVIKNPSTVEDLVQESLIKAYRSITSFRGDSAFYTWLYKIGLNTARNYLYDAKRSVHIDESIMLEDAENFSTAIDVHHADTPETELINKQIATTVNDAISELPAELQMAITLREIEGLSYEQISDIMGCPIGTTRSRIFRARDMISQKLKPLINAKPGKRW
jgi:RNA polymerase sigma-70 factor (ECF subfamily)